MRRTLCFIVGLVSLIYAFSQKVENVTASFTYYAQETMSVEEAKRAALEGAKIEAIANKFGTNVSQHTTSFMSNKDDEFYLFADTDVKGEWIETTGEPKYDVSYKDKNLIVTCTVKGKAREIISPKIEFKAKPLRNGVEEKFESYEFKNGDFLYMLFQAPISGYLAIYLVDKLSEEVYCALPYRSSDGSPKMIEPDKEYILFSQKYSEPLERRYVDEYEMTCSQDKEYNDFYILFSEAPFSKMTMTEEYNFKLPKTSNLKDFQKWLTKVRVKNPKLTLEKIPIIIYK